MKTRKLSKNNVWKYTDRKDGIMLIWKDLIKKNQQIFEILLHIKQQEDFKK